MPRLMKKGIGINSLKAFYCIVEMKRLYLKKMPSTSVANEDWPPKVGTCAFNGRTVLLHGSH